MGECVLGDGEQDGPESGHQGDPSLPGEIRGEKDEGKGREREVTSNIGTRHIYLWASTIERVGALVEAGMPHLLDNKCLSSSAIHPYLPTRHPGNTSTYQQSSITIHLITHSSY